MAVLWTAHRCAMGEVSIYCLVSPRQRRSHGCARVCLGHPNAILAHLKKSIKKKTRFLSIRDHVSFESTEKGYRLPSKWCLHFQLSLQVICVTRVLFAPLIFTWLRPPKVSQAHLHYHFWLRPCSTVRLPTRRFAPGVCSTWEIHTGVSKEKSYILSPRARTLSTTSVSSTHGAWRSALQAQGCYSFPI